MYYSFTMPSYSQQYYSTYNTVELYDLVADVEKYPEFLPWVYGARVEEKSDNTLIAELLIRFKAVKNSYISHVSLNKPKDKNSDGSVLVKLVEGPFSYLNNQWTFKHLPDGKTRVSFNIDFAFRSSLLEKMIGSMFERAIKEMLESFEKRAEELYK